MDDSDSEITELLGLWKNGRRDALDRLTPLVYREMKLIAQRFLRNERRDHTLQPTALIHEAYIRLADQSMPAWQNRAHFFGVAAHIMRQILVDLARKRRSAKRGGGQMVHVDLELSPAVKQPPVDVIDLDEALKRLAEVDERKSRVIELRYFGGLSREETAAALGLTLATVKRDLLLGEAWLRRELNATPGHQ